MAKIKQTRKKILKSSLDQTREAISFFLFWVQQVTEIFIPCILYTYFCMYVRVSMPWHGMPRNCGVAHSKTCHSVMQNWTFLYLLLLLSFNCVNVQYNSNIFMFVYKTIMCHAIAVFKYTVCQKKNLIPCSDRHFYCVNYNNTVFRQRLLLRKSQ